MEQVKSDMDEVLKKEQEMKAKSEGFQGHTRTLEKNLITVMTERDQLRMKLEDIDQKNA